MWIDLGSIPGFGRSPGEGKGYPFQYSGLENSMDCIGHGIKESDTTEIVSFSCIKKSKNKELDAVGVTQCTGRSGGNQGDADPRALSPCLLPGF